MKLLGLKRSIQKIAWKTERSWCDMKDILMEQQEKYPLMEAVDYYKLIYQHTFGVRHELTDEATSLERLVEEYGKVSNNHKRQAFSEPIGNGYVRVHLASKEITRENLVVLNKLFIATSNYLEGTIREFEAKLDELLELSKQDKLTINSQRVEDVIAFYKSKSYPAVSHSDVFREYYEAHYRVIAERYIPYFSPLEEIMKLSQKEEPQIIAIDGRCGSGKTTFSEILQQNFDCNVFHMDDFFLPKELKTADRLSEPGGNVHYERVLEQILLPLANQETVKLIPFNCSINDLDQAVSVPYKKLNIVEGVYALHPALEKYYDYKIFMTVDSGVQVERIRKRNASKLHKFIDEWIPLEEKYFNTLGIEEKADYIINTSSGANNKYRRNDK